MPTPHAPDDADRAVDPVHDPGLDAAAARAAALALDALPPIVLPGGGRVLLHRKSGGLGLRMVVASAARRIARE